MSLGKTPSSSPATGDAWANPFLIAGQKDSQQFGRQSKDDPLGHALRESSQKKKPTAETWQIKEKVWINM